MTTNSEDITEPPISRRSSSSMRYLLARQLRQSERHMGFFQRLYLRQLEENERQSERNQRILMRQLRQSQRNERVLQDLVVSLIRQRSNPLSIDSDSEGMNMTNERSDEELDESESDLDEDATDRALRAAQLQDEARTSPGTGEGGLHESQFNAPTSNVSNNIFQSETRLQATPDQRDAQATGLSNTAVDEVFTGSSLLQTPESGIGYGVPRGGFTRGGSFRVRGVRGRGVRGGGGVRGGVPRGGFHRGGGASGAQSPQVVARESQQDVPDAP